MLVIKAIIHKMLVMVANKEDPDQTASSDLFVYAFLIGNKLILSVLNFRTLF